jgi:hypothetical protein
MLFVNVENRGADSCRKYLEFRHTRESGYPGSFGRKTNLDSRLARE